MSQLDESLADHHLHHHGQSFAVSGPRSMDSSFQDSPTIGRTQVLSLAGTQGYTANSPLPTPSSTASSRLGVQIGLSASDSADETTAYWLAPPDLSGGCAAVQLPTPARYYLVQKDSRAEPIAIEQRRLSPDKSRPNAVRLPVPDSLFLYSRLCPADSDYGGPRGQPLAGSRENLLQQRVLRYYHSRGENPRAGAIAVSSLATGSE
ncbi:hypothetical protein MMYC01_204592 [Madurella mycetomatis]|uniref:Uncharacterized protein n=1 Tax=Madurella mycetomatis TaxID=100816 RepID=A0A175W4Y9_9PEZI|nr:hypothetical protein MMYC01_204592 [Madurella mycetomatis]